MSKKILITGGLGYVGGRVSKYLEDNTDSFLRITSRKSKEVNPEWLRNGEIVGLDLFSNESCNGICKGIDTVIHFAALNEIESVENPEKALMVNGLGTLRLLNEAQKSGVKRFIYFSTAHIYGSPLKGVITEDTLTRPVHPYAITHKVAEDFVLSFHDKKILIGMVLRLSNSFGAPISMDVNRWSLLVNDLCRQAVTTGKMVLKSSGVQKRDFIPLNSVCKITEHFINLSSDQCGNGIFNLGYKYSKSILDMTNLVASRCKELLNINCEIIRPESNNNEKIEFLDYRVDKLEETGFSISASEEDIISEIDDTLCLISKGMSK